MKKINKASPDRCRLKYLSEQEELVLFLCRPCSLVGGVIVAVARIPIDEDGRRQRQQEKKELSGVSSHMMTWQ